MIEIDVELERWLPSPVVRPVSPGYTRIPAGSFRDTPAGLTSRQGMFYRNLIRIAEAVGGADLPVDFRLPSGEALYLDRGCISIAVHAGFLAPLGNDRSGLVSTLTLAWRA